MPLNAVRRCLRLGDFEGPSTAASLSAAVPSDIRPNAGGRFITGVEMRGGSPLPSDTQPVLQYASVQSSLVPENFSTLAHLSVSISTKLANGAGP